MKAKTLFYCTECGNETPKWSGQCPACRAWNTLVERPAEPKKRSAAAASVAGGGLRGLEYGGGAARRTGPQEGRARPGDIRYRRPSQPS